MRELIRPTLFITARTGLFLAVVAWIVGQWCGVELRYEHGGCTYQVGWDYRVIFASRFPHPLTVRGWEIMMDDYAKLTTPEKWAAYPEHIRKKNDELNERVRASHLIYVPGFVYVAGRSNVTWPSVSIELWFLTTALIAFNIVLHFIYRKRPEVQPCEN